MQVLLNSSTILPILVPIWVDDLTFTVTVEMEEKANLMEEEVKNGMSSKQQKEVRRCSCRVHRERRRKKMTSATLFQISNRSPN